MRQDQFDLLVDFGPRPRLNAILTALARARFTAGFRTARQARHFAHDLAVEHQRWDHELENHRRLIRALGFPADHQPAIDRRKIPRNSSATPRSR